MKAMRWAVAICGLILAREVAAAATPLSGVTINGESIAQMQKRHPLGSAEVDDPVYKRKQRYEGIWLRDLLKDMSYAGHAESDVYVRFRCKDGYAPIMPLARALSGKGLLAVRDLNAPAGKSWELFSANGQTSTPAPAYLVWASPGDIEEFPWPYQIVAIELTTSADVLGAAMADDSRRPGFDLFVKHCLKCHAVNGVGGTFGPDLNIPCSVTEYWNPAFLGRFIADAGSIRAGTRMPGFQSLTGAEIQAIIQYLEYMGGHKKAGAACPSGR
ncbi:MAG TPA: c-type cytochrome [Verrucomicrobiae bacterium]|nr:c-type cytochrome [Verrucomicrobiae bacterium]